MNVGKCKSMSYYRVRASIIFDYSIEVVDVTRVEEVTDREILMESQLDFKALINNKFTKAHSMLGFLERICADFGNLRCLTSIFRAHVKSNLEYPAEVWSPSTKMPSDDIESIQTRFVLFALRRSVRRNSEYQRPSYDEMRKILGLGTSL